MAYEPLKSNSLWWCTPRRELDKHPGPGHLESHLAPPRIESAGGTENCGELTRVGSRFWFWQARADNRIGFIYGAHNIGSIRLHDLAEFFLLVAQFRHPRHTRAISFCHVGRPTRVSEFNSRDIVDRSGLYLFTNGKANLPGISSHPGTIQDLARFQSEGIR